jgi:hypothetical protein
MSIPSPMSYCRHWWGVVSLDAVKTWQIPVGTNPSASATLGSMHVQLAPLSINPRPKIAFGTG